jgi:hypothetical protein
MRRMLIAAVATTALALPGVALAHAGEHQHGNEVQREHHGELHHHRHHHHAHLLTFHAQAPVTAPSTGAGAPPPSASTIAERAGTIASFGGGTLTIALNDGSTVSGKVTPQTEIECDSATASAAEDGDGGRDGGDDDAQDEAEHCTQAVLVPGASVREVVLSVDSAGASWVKLEL